MMQEEAVPSSRTRYALHAGYVVSRNDGQQHYISCAKLQRLYNLPPRDCICHELGNPRSQGLREEQGIVHLYPRSDGNYQLPTPDREAASE